jgi:hypothetical protein
MKSPIPIPSIPESIYITPNKYLKLGFTSN